MVKALIQATTTVTVIIGVENVFDYSITTHQAVIILNETNDISDENYFLKGAFDIYAFVYVKTIIIMKQYRVSLILIFIFNFFVAFVLSAAC